MKYFLVAILVLLVFSSGFLSGKILNTNKTNSASTSTVANSTTQASNTQNPPSSSTAPSPNVALATLNSNSSQYSSATQNTGPQNDIVEIQKITASPLTVQIGEDINFSVTIQNQSQRRKNITLICFNSDEGNFGCLPGKGMSPNDVFNITNSGRFHSAGSKNVWITWSQDSNSFYRPVSAGVATVIVQ